METETYAHQSKKHVSACMHMPKHFPVRIRNAKKKRRELGTPHHCGGFFEAPNLPKLPDPTEGGKVVTCSFESRKHMGSIGDNFPQISHLRSWIENTRVYPKHKVKLSTQSTIAQRG